jgi:signal transduction histidine kinase/CheY-like chemotaxis protein/HPt (histidine-containing phosphotransfer) domain-containing protein
LTTKASETDRAVIGKAGKATAVLQFFAVGLAVVLGTIYYDISNRYTAMQSGIRENAMWSVYQLDREARNLSSELSVMLATGDIGLPAQKRLSTRYDILYSRMDMLGRTKFERFFAVDETVAGELTAIQQSVFGNVAIFDDIARGVPASRASLTVANVGFKDLLRNTERLVTYTNTDLSTDRAEQREQVTSLEIKSLILIGFLVLIVGAIILTLRRQLKSVRMAGLSFERMAANLESAYQAAEAGNRARSQFMATMSHEIRTPLNAILGTVELMQLSPKDAEATRNLKTIQKSGEALLDIINEILDFSKIEHGKLELESHDVDIRSCAEGVVEMIRGRALDSGNHVALDIPAELAAPYIRTDATRLRQVVMNLMSNAVKFTKEGTVTLSVREAVVGDAISLRVEVRDTGIGIDKAGRAKLFLPFSQVDASIARKYGGTGLGLTICKEIVERLGGRIGVDSVPGSGSTFWFEIPVKQGQAPTAAVARSGEHAEALPRLKILLVEDNAVNLHVARKFLDHIGQEVDTAENGAVAVEMAAARDYDLILMDMQMPVMDGIEATSLIRAGTGKSRNSLIVAMTANASDDDMKKCIEAGMDGFQSKPVSIEKLRRVIRSATAGRTIATPSREQPLPAAAATAGMTSVAGQLDLSAFEERRAELVSILGEEDFRELVDAFFSDARSALETLAADLESGRAEATDRLLHTIKGAAGNVGLQPVARLAQTMRDMPFDREALTTLAATVDRYSEALAV